MNAIAQLLGRTGLLKHDFEYHGTPVPGDFRP